MQSRFVFLTGAILLLAAAQVRAQEPAPPPMPPSPLPPVAAQAAPADPAAPPAAVAPTAPNGAEVPAAPIPGQPAAAPAQPADPAAAPAVPGAAPAPGEAAPLPGAPATPVAPTAPTEVVKTDINDEQQLDELKDLLYKSMMFTPSEMRRLRSAIYTYRLNQKRLKEMADKPAQEVQDIVTAVVQQNQQQPRQIEHPQFYLSSVVYHDKGNWALWVNGKMYTPEQQPDPELTVVEVNSESATFNWRPRMFAYYTARQPADPRQMVAVNQDDGSVTFTLFPYQSFSPFSMYITEGALPPVYTEQIVIPSLPGDVLDTGAAKTGATPGAATRGTDIGNKLNEKLGTGLKKDPASLPREGGRATLIPTKE